MTQGWRDRSVYVTGATGLLGGWLVRALVEEGASVVCLVRDWTPKSLLLSGDLLKQVTLVRGDLTDGPLQSRLLAEYEVEVVFHLAAQTIVGIANRSPLSTFESNIQGTWLLLEAARHLPHVQAVVVASSDKAYGDKTELPYGEDMALEGRHPYDVSKSCADLIAQAYAHTYDLNVAITRCGNLYGGGDLNFNRIVPGTIRSVLRGEAPVVRSDGTLVRDYLYAQDAAAAYLDLAAHMLEKPLPGEAFNISYEQPLSVLQVVAEVLGAMGASDLKPQVLGQAPNEIREQFLSAKKAKDMLGWRPKFGFAEGLLKTIGWYRDLLG